MSNGDQHRASASPGEHPDRAERVRRLQPPRRQAPVTPVGGELGLGTLGSNDPQLTSRPPTPKTTPLAARALKQPRPRRVVTERSTRPTSRHRAPSPPGTPAAAASSSSPAPQPPAEPAHPGPPPFSPSPAPCSAWANDLLSAQVFPNHLVGTNRAAATQAIATELADPGHKPTCGDSPRRSAATPTPATPVVHTFSLPRATPLAVHPAR